MTRRQFAAFTLALAVQGTPVTAHGADRGLAKATFGGKTVVVDYGRPLLQGRDMMALLSKLPAGQPWRMGADAPTTLKTEVDLAFGATTVAKGDYVLTAGIAGGKWTLLLSDRDKATVAEVPLAEAKLAEAVEMFTIELTAQGTKGRFAMKWGVSEMSAPFTVK